MLCYEMQYLWVNALVAGDYASAARFNRMAAAHMAKHIVLDWRQFGIVVLKDGNRILDAPAEPAKQLFGYDLADFRERPSLIYKWPSEEYRAYELADQMYPDAGETDITYLSRRYEAIPAHLTVQRVFGNRYVFIPQVLTLPSGLENLVRTSAKCRNYLALMQQRSEMIGQVYRLANAPGSWEGRTRPCVGDLVRVLRFSADLKDVVFVGALPTARGAKVVSFGNYNCYVRISWLEGPIS